MKSRFDVISVMEKLIHEAEKKKKKKAKVDEPTVRVDGLMADPRMDFSKPLGVANTYKLQGYANFGPFTGDVDALKAGPEGSDLEMSRHGSKFKESAWSTAINILNGKKVIK